MGLWNKVKQYAGAANPALVPTTVLASTFDSITGAKGAKERERAAQQASGQARGDVANAQYFSQRQYGRARGDVNSATGNAITAVEAGNLDAADAARGYGRLASSQLTRGANQATGYLQGQPNRLADLYAQDFSGGFQADPGYQFRLQQGEKAINQAAAAHGGRLSGDTLKALAGFNQDLASQEYANWNQRRINAATGADQGDWQRNSALANLAMGTGQANSGISQHIGDQLYGGSLGTGQQIGNLFAGQGSQLANLAQGYVANNTALTGMNIGAGMAPVQYAGGASDAGSNFWQQILGGVVGGIGTAAGKRI